MGKVSPLAEKILAIDGFWGKGSQFSLRVCPKPGRSTMLEGMIPPTPNTDWATQI